MSLIQYRPFRNEFSLPNFSNLMGNFFDSETFEAAKGTLPAVNIKENEQDFSVELAAPGLKKEDFKLELANRILSISSEKTNEKEEKTGNYTRKEFGFSSFKRSFSIPENVDQDQISANYTDGILKLVLPKSKKDNLSKTINIS